MEYPSDRKTIVLETIRMVVEQGRRSYSDVGCVYRNPEGLKCALGHWIPDEVTESSWWNTHSCNRYPIAALRERLWREEPDHPLTRWLTTNTALVRELQIFHDYRTNWATPLTLWKAAANLLHDHDLEVPEGWGPDWVASHWKES